jgi:hypothetical protein
VTYFLISEGHIRAYVDGKVVAEEKVTHGLALCLMRALVGLLR